MIHLILALIAIAIAFVIIKKLGKFVLYMLGGVVTIAILAISGIQISLGFFTEFTTKYLHARRLILGLMLLVTIALAVSFTFYDAHPTYDSYSFLSWRFFISACLLLGCFVSSGAFKEVFKLRSDFSTAREKEKHFYITVFSSFYLLTSCTLLFLLTKFFKLSPDVVFYLEHSIWAISIISLLAVLVIPSELSKIVDAYELELSGRKKIRLTELSEIISKDLSQLNDNVGDLVRNLLSIDVINGRIIEIDFKDDSWVFIKETYDDAVNVFKESTRSQVTIEKGILSSSIASIFGFNNKESNEYIELYLEDGEFFNFQSGPKFVSYLNRNKVKICVCCGLTETCNDDDGNWICSDICKETEVFCEEIKGKPYEDFIKEASTSGFIVMAGAYSWSENHKIVNPTSDTGHGFAAERANNIVDNMQGKNASVVGGDNAKDGADRIVNGDLIQTKYCRTAQKSVNQSFDNKGTGNYRYLDSNGKPMQLEVPKDQYDNAVSAMEQKIREGKVPGVTDPNEAKQIIRRGSITYEQARNITKFCTVESLTFDVIDGAVVGASAAGISFAITASIYYLNTKDTKKAIQTAALQAGKTFANTLVIYVSAQQLHRLKPVVSVLNKIDVKHMPKSVKDFLSSGYGVKSSSLNKALRGTVVTSAIVITVSTGPDLVKMIRGRISGGQFLQNLSVVSSGVVAGTVGSIAGAALLSPLGPAAAFGGRILGGVIGGHVGAFVATTIAGKLRVDDKTQMVNLIKSQLEFLAFTFNLTADELACVQKNIQTVANDEMLEKLFAAKSNRIAYANYCIKPIVVAVVKQRPVLKFNNKDIFESIKKIAA